MLVRSVSLLVVVRGSEPRRLFELVVRRWQQLLPEFLVRDELDLVSAVSEAQVPVRTHDVQDGRTLPWLLCFRRIQRRRLERL